VRYRNGECENDKMTIWELHSDSIVLHTGCELAAFAGPPASQISTSGLLNIGG